jgi:hypothetical protein
MSLQHAENTFDFIHISIDGRGDFLLVIEREPRDSAFAIFWDGYQKAWPMYGPNPETWKNNHSRMWDCSSSSFDQSLYSGS